jgi:thiamine pyrophosphate-dependent acetolactate synthase large subunit-like protein
LCTKYKILDEPTSEAPTVVQIDMSYATVGRNRDISLGLVGDVGAILATVAQAASGRAHDGARSRDEWVSYLRAAVINVWLDPGRVCTGHRKPNDVQIA